VHLPLRAPTATNGCKATAELLFVQTAEEAELAFGPSGNLTLVMRNVSSITTYFTGAPSCAPAPAWLPRHQQGLMGALRSADKPERRAGSVYTQRFSQDRSFYAMQNTSGQWLGRPNAALYGLQGVPVRSPIVWRSGMHSLSRRPGSRPSLGS